MKKLLSLLLVMIMIVALAVPAYAADDEIIINFPSIWVGTRECRFHQGCR